MRLLDLILVPEDKQRRNEDKHRAELYSELLHWEAKIGGEIFGPIPKGVRREFFCLDERTWVWHEEWKDNRGKQKTMTTRYEVRQNGVVKAQGVNSYQNLSEEEMRRLSDAVGIYYQRVMPVLNHLKQTVH